MVTLYFSAIASVGHTFGHESRQTRTAIAEIDEQIARLWRSIGSIAANDDPKISLLLVSDHGMAEVGAYAFIDTNDLPRIKGVKPVNGSTRVTYYRRDPEADIEALAMDLDQLADGRFLARGPRHLGKASLCGSSSGWVDHH